MDPLFIVLLGIVTVLFCIIVLRLHAFLSLLSAALVTGMLTSQAQLFHYAVHSGMSEAAAKSFSTQHIGQLLANAFGNTVGKIGILIALASVIGTALMKSGGAERIVRGLMWLVGKKNTSLALLASSFTLGIPVFFDTVFYLLIPIVKSAGIRNPSKYSLFLMCSIAGGVMTHSLVPPTPGPLFVAKELNIDIGLMMIWGIIVGAITVFFGYCYALWANQKWPLPMRETSDISIEELRNNADRRQEALPGLGLSLLPILLPIVLITGKTMFSMDDGTRSSSGSDDAINLFTLVELLGDSTLALFVSTLIALYLLWSKTKEKKIFEKTVSESLTGAGMIILITAAGGAFGQMLQHTDIGDKVGTLAMSYQTAVLPLAFFITLVVRTAQGSATVAMVTAIGVMSGIGTAENLGFHPIYLAIAIGCGSKIFPWMNDSGFWIITKMSGMETKESIRFFSFLLTIMGFTGLLAVMLLAWINPMV